MGNKTYVIADIHGRLDLLEKALSLTGPGAVIFLGDYIDRGPQSAQVIDLLMSGPQRDDQSWVCLMGNHESMMLSVDFGVMKAADWIMNGGDKTRESYTSHDQWKSHVAWMYGLELAVRDNHRAYVHAMLPEKYVWGDPLSETAIWGRVRGDVGAGDLHMVHGHTPAPNLELLTKRTNLDGGAVFTGRLAVGVFDDDLPGGPIEILWAMEAK